jgi:hypothetical protein
MLTFIRSFNGFLIFRLVNSIRIDENNTVVKMASRKNSVEDLVTAASRSSNGSLRTREPRNVSVAGWAWQELV